MAVRIVVDSTADMPNARARDLGITVVPLTVTFGEQTFYDGVDLDGPTFYEKLKSSPVTPTTSTPSPGDFDVVYRRVVQQGATGILSLHIASKLSGTFSAASAAAEAVTAETGVPIRLIDSTSVSGGFGLPAQIVAQEARQGASLDDLFAHAQSLCSRVRVLAVLDTLEFLQRGGRIGKARAFVGTLLSVKPLIEVRDGQVLELEKVRTKSRAHERMAEIVGAMGELEALAVVASDQQVAEEMTAVARKVWSGPVEQFALGPVVGTHAGPGAGGIAAIARG